MIPMRSDANGASGGLCEAADVRWDAKLLGS